MLVPFSWLKDYVDIDEKPENVAERLLLSGTKVEGIKAVDEENILEFEITPNRGDCLGVIGIAREASVLFGKELNIPEPFSETISTRRKKIRLTVKNPDLCRFYTIGVIDSLKVGESSAWIKERLTMCGVRPVNNVVDITNYVMLETSQPMHAFDFEKISGDMTLRAARDGENVVTLDGAERSLNKGAIIIEDSEKLIDLAGLMGGKNTEVGENTKTIVLHVPIYNPTAIRRASLHTNLRTEASNRFEKSLDPNGHRYAFERALHLLKIEAGGSLASEIKSVGYPVKSSVITISSTRIREILGIEISDEDIINILSDLGFEIMPNPSFGESQLDIRPPTWRGDIKITEDVAEEVGRIWGYNRFPKNLPAGDVPTHKDSFSPDWVQKIKSLLQAVGLTETYSHSLTDLKRLSDAGFKPEQSLKVSNRMTIDYEYLRPTLLIGLLQATSLNLTNFENFSLYEISRVFFKNIDKKTKLPEQPRKISAVSTNLGFQALKGVVESIFSLLHINNYKFLEGGPGSIWDKGSSEVFIGETPIGYLGKIKPDVLDAFSIEREIQGFELNLEDLLENAKEDVSFEPLLKFPSVKEDLSIAIPMSTSVREILDSVMALKEPRIRGIEIGEVIGWKNKKSVLLNIEYYDPKKTLTNNEVEVIRKEIITKLESIDGSEIRK